MLSNQPQRPKTRPPFRKTREAIKDIYEILRRYRPIGGGLLETSANGFRVRNPTAAPAPALQFTPSISPIEGDEAKALSIAPGWVCTEWADGFQSDQFEIPMRYKFFMPEIAGVPIGGDPDATPDPIPPPTLTLPASQKSLVWLEVILLARQVQIGATDMRDGSLGPGVYGRSHSTGFGTITTDEHTEGEHTHTHPELTGPTNPSGGFTHDHNIVTDLTHVHDAETYFDALHYHKDTEAPISFIVTSDTAEPDEGETSKYVNVGFYELDANGDITDSEWYIEGGAYTLPQQSFIKGRSTLLLPGPGSDATANPKEATT